MNRLILTIAALTSVALTFTVFGQQPIAKGLWDHKDGKPYSVNFEYGTNLKGPLDGATHRSYTGPTLYVTNT